ncbi:MAG: phosphopantetheine-binding protein [Paracoccaceae bacterium]
MPQTANGKRDRKGLPDPKDAAPIRLLRTIEPPVGPIETQIADIWRDVLGLEELSVTETIFALGADSLTIFRLAARQIEAGLDLEARHILEHCTVRALAAQVQAGSISAQKRPSLADFRRTPRTGT